MLTVATKPQLRDVAEEGERLLGFWAPGSGNKWWRSTRDDSAKSVLWW